MKSAPVLTIINIKTNSKNTFVSVMFRQITTILLLAAFSIQVFNRAIVVADYYVNSSAYIKNCENKAAPELNCEGKCQVSKKMNDEEKKEQNSERKGNSNEVACSKTAYASLLAQNLTIVPVIYKDYCFCIPTSVCSEIFHPPGLN